MISVCGQSKIIEHVNTHMNNKNQQAQENIEVDSIGKMISKPLKEKIKYDATELNFLKKTTRAKLPL